MCRECGCGQPENGHMNDPDHDHPHGHDHPHENGHVHPENSRRTLAVNASIYSENDLDAQRNRGYFQAFGLLVVNVVSSPGSGKTALVAATISRMEGIRAAVIVGDLATDNDARRFRDRGIPSIQVTTGTICHLDARMVWNAMKKLDLKDQDMLFIENVGNLVCPAGFDLGEKVRVVLLSVTEGEDKPLKYPPMFRFADAVVITKTDLAEAAGFDRDTALKNIRLVNPGAKLFETSSKTGRGMEEWISFLRMSRQDLNE